MSDRLPEGYSSSPDEPFMNEFQREYFTRKLLAKIDATIERTVAGTCGYCAETGKPIGLERPEARLTTSLCIEAQEEHERQERRGSPRTDSD